MNLYKQNNRLVIMALGAVFIIADAMADETGKSFFMIRTTCEDAVLMNSLRHDLLDRVYEDQATVIPHPQQPHKEAQAKNWLEYLFPNKSYTKKSERAEKSYGHDVSYSTYQKSLKVGFAATVFYEQSKGCKDLARYFFPGNKTELSIDANPNVSTDIWAPWLNIVGKEDPLNPNVNAALPFHSNLKIRPKHKSFGIIFQAVKKFTHGLFMSIDMPCVQVEHDLHVTEFDIQNAAATHDQLPQELVTLVSPPGGTIVAGGSYRQLEQISVNATQAFNSPLWKYGKIKDGVQKLAGIADINLTLGYEFYHDQSKFWGMHLNALIPMGYKPQAEFVFEPLIGNARHFGFGIGADGGLLCISGNRCDLSIRGMINTTYLFEGAELRTFDLISQGPWSRYLLVADPQTEGLGAVPAINFLTLNTSVEPGFTGNFLTNMNLDWAWGNVEVGYNIWFKTRERLRVKQDPQPVSFVAASQLSSGAAPAIDQSISGIPNFNTPLQKSDLNVSVATNAFKLTHTLFANVYCDASCNHQPLIFNVGVKYEFGHDNRTLNQWGVTGGLKLLI